MWQLNTINRFMCGRWLAREAWKASFDFSWWTNSCRRDVAHQWVLCRIAVEQRLKLLVPTRRVALWFCWRLALGLTDFFKEPPNLMLIISYHNVLHSKSHLGVYPMYPHFQRSPKWERSIDLPSTHWEAGVPTLLLIVMSSLRPRIIWDHLGSSGMPQT